MAGAGAGAGGGLAAGAAPGYDADAPGYGAAAAAPPHACAGGGPPPYPPAPNGGSAVPAANHGSRAQVQISEKTQDVQHTPRAGRPRTISVCVSAVSARCGRWDIVALLRVRLGCYWPERRRGAVGCRWRVHRRRRRARGRRGVNGHRCRIPWRRRTAVAVLRRQRGRGDGRNICTRGHRHRRRVWRGGRAAAPRWRPRRHATVVVRPQLRERAREGLVPARRLAALLRGAEILHNTRRDATHKREHENSPMRQIAPTRGTHTHTHTHATHQ